MTIELENLYLTFDFAEFIGVPIRIALNASHAFIQEMKLNAIITKQECV
jgi:hypothetical protein